MAKGNFAGMAMLVVEGAVVVGTGKIVVEEIDVLFQEIVVVVEIVDLKVVD